VVDAYQYYTCFGEVSFFTIKIEQGKANKFCLKLKKTATEMFQMLKGVYGEKCLSRTSVFE
jgi:hypothetical protein